MSNSPSENQKPWIPVIVKWLHKYEVWKSRIEKLEEKAIKEVKVTSGLSGMPGGGGKSDSTCQTALDRIEAKEELLEITERVHILDLAFKAMKHEEMELIRRVYIVGIGDENPWDVLKVGRTTYFKIRKRVLEKIYYIGWEEIDLEIQKRSERFVNGS